MDNLDDSENNAKISDSAYSNSCSNSQSRRSHSSKSTHSGSNSSGSSGYGGKPSTTGSSGKIEIKKDKEGKKRKKSLSQISETQANEPAVLVCSPPEPPIPLSDEPQQETDNVVETSSSPVPLPEDAVDKVNVSPLESHPIKDEATNSASESANLVASCNVAQEEVNGFSCVISMHDGVVMYTQHLTTNLDFPKDMWVGRSFIDFVHPRDRNTFASQITNGLAVPEIVKTTQDSKTTAKECSMVCRVRRYKGLGKTFGIKEGAVSYLPFLLKFCLKDVKGDDGKFVYLIIQATPLYSTYKTPNERLTDSAPFVIRHSAAGVLDYIDMESVPYLGYLPQEVQSSDALHLYHPDDLPYLKLIYETIVKEGSVGKSLPYRMLAQNGEYVKLETEWSSFINPWTRKLEFVIGKHFVIEGPENPDVFLAPPQSKPVKYSAGHKITPEKAEAIKKSILKILKDVLTKPAEKAKQQMNKRCQDLALIMESLLEEPPKVEGELTLDVQEPDLNCFERDSVMLGGISPHHENNDSTSSTETPLSYNQLNYNENLQRYFDSHPIHSAEVNAEEIGSLPDVCGNAQSTNDLKHLGEGTSKSLMPPVAQHSTWSPDAVRSGSPIFMLNNTSPSGSHTDLHVPRLTESRLTKHNSEMEKELAKLHRECRYSSKGEKASDTKQKKKEHLARCNASFQPTMANAASEYKQEACRPQTLKRTTKTDELEVPNKQPCTHTRSTRRRRHCTSPKPLNIAPSPVGLMPSYFPSAAVPAYMHAPSTSGQPACLEPHQLFQPMHQVQPYPGTSMPWVYPQQLYGASYLYPQLPYNMHPQQAMMAQPLVFNQSITQVQSNHLINQPMDQSINQLPKQLANQPMNQPMNQSMYQPMNQSMYQPKNQSMYQPKNDPMNMSFKPLGLTNSSYIEACKATSLQAPLSKPVRRAPWKEGPDVLMTSSSNMDMSSYGGSSSNALDRSAEGTPNMHDAQRQAGPSGLSGQSDGELSYSSFYSSFLRTDSGSAEESSDPKKPGTDICKKNEYTYQPPEPKKACRRINNPPWLDQVNMTHDIQFKYQITPKTTEETLQADLEKIKTFEQPELVNEQLNQLYLDMQLQGIAARLTLEEGITSSSSSGESSGEAFNSKLKAKRRRPYSKLHLIYEEDAPFPPPPDFQDPACPQTSDVVEPTELTTTLA